MVLYRVGEAVEEQVYPQQRQTVDAACGVGFGLAGLRRVVECEESDAARDGQHDQVLGERVALAEQRDVQGHHGQQFAGLREHKRQVVDVGERGVAEGRGERGCEGDKEEGWERRARGEDVVGTIGLVEEVEAPAREGEERLDRVQHNREPEVLCLRLRRRVDRVWCRGDALL